MKRKVKNEQGITLIALILTCIILGILASVGIYSGVETVRSSRFTAFTTELKVLQTNVNDWYQEYRDGNNNVLTSGDEISSNSTVQSQANLVFTAGESGITDQTGYRYFSSDTLISLGIENIEEDYFINIEKRSVVSYEGFEYDGETYYTIEQIPDGMYNVEYEMNTGAPTFDVSYKEINDNQWEITISNIQYSGNVQKWEVNYQLNGETTWNTSENLTFTVNKTGTYNITISNKDITSGEPVSILVENLPEIPNGAVISQIPGENTVSGGLVIYVTNGEEIENWDNVEEIRAKYDQFVWIPVDKETAIIEEGKEITGVTDEEKNNSLREYVENGGTGEKRYPMAVKRSNGTYSGILYDFTEGTNGVEITVKDYVTENSHREPAYLPDEQHADGGNNNDTNPKVSEELLQTEYATMIEKVAEQGGFWVGRYETSNFIDDNTQDTTNKISIVKSATTGVSGMRWYRMYAQQKAYVSNVQKTNSSSLSGLTSSMIWGSQWDQIMIWLKGEKKGNNYYILNASGVANYKSNDSYTSTTAPEPTGCFIVRNIYDLAGNLEERTLEARDDCFRIARGGHYNTEIGGVGGNVGASYRANYASPDFTYTYDGSRLTLY